MVNGHFSRCGFLSTDNLSDCSCEATRYRWALIVAVIIFTGELFGGWWTGSLALLSDAWHVFSDAAGLWVALIASVAARKIQSHGKKIRAWATQISAALLVGAIIMIVVGAFDRLLSSAEIRTEWMVFIAFIGMIGNIVQHYLLETAGEDGRDALHAITSTHVIADATQSAVVVIGGVVIWKTGWVWIDPVLSLGIAIVLSWWVVKTLRTGELGHSHAGNCGDAHHHHDHHH